MDLRAFYEASRARITAAIASLDKSIVSGNVQSFENYHRLVGKREGLLEAEASLQYIWKKMVEERPLKPNTAGDHDGRSVY